MKDTILVVMFHGIWSLVLVVCLSPYYTVPITEALLTWAKVMFLVGLAIIVMSYGDE